MVILWLIAGIIGGFYLGIFTFTIAVTQKVVDKLQQIVDNKADINETRGQLTSARLSGGLYVPTPPHRLSLDDVLKLLQPDHWAQLQINGSCWLDTPAGFYKITVANKRMRLQ